MTPDQATALEKHIIAVASEKANAVLNAMVLIHVRLAKDLIAKGVFTRQEYASSMAAIQKETIQNEPASSRKETPELFAALALATMILEQAFAEKPTGKPS